MRAYEILLESQNYDSMFSKLVELHDIVTPSHKADIAKFVKDEIRWAKSELLRQDRIIWYLRHVKLALCKIIVRNIDNDESAINNERLAAIKDLLIQKIIPKTASTMGGHGASQSEYGPFEQSVISGGFKNTVNHWISVTDVAPAASQLVWNTQTPDEMDGLFDKIEGEWREAQSQIVNIQDGDEEIIKINGTMSWWKLDREYCRDEGAAMGHCGNSADHRSGDRILSLRTTIDVENGWYRPHLTFILTHGGYLGEMKGRANEKPNKKYHPAIVQLLRRTDIIKGIIGGGYAADSNFHLDDLDDDKLIAELLELNPNLLSLSEAYEKYGDTPDVRYRILQGIIADTEDMLIVGESSRFTPDQIDADFVTRESYTVKELIDDYGNDTSQWVCELLDGGDHLDYHHESDEYMIKDLYRTFLKKHPGTHEEIIKWLGTVSNYDEEEDDDWLDWIFDESDDGDLLIHVANNAIRHGAESGTMSEMYDQFKSLFHHTQISADSEEFSLDNTYQFTISMNGIMRELRHDCQCLDEAELGPAIKDMATDGFELEMRNDRFDGYDEHESLSYLLDRLFEEGILAHPDNY